MGSMATSSAVFNKQATGTKRRNVPADGPDESKEVVMEPPGQTFYVTQIWDGTACIAQAAVAAFSITVVGRIIARPLVLFSWHPLSQIFSLILLLQSILVLQPAHTAGQKRIGRTVHAYLNGASFLLFTAGFAAVYLNKERRGMPHFTTLHGLVGSVATLSLWAQQFVGFTMWATPSLYGGKAKAMWRWHRAGGYANLAFLLSTFCTAGTTGFVRGALGTEPWVFFVAMALIAIGVVPRIHGYKLCFGKRRG